MKLNIAGQIFDTDEVNEISIREARKEVFVSTNDNFYRIRYQTEKDISDVIYWKKLANITSKDIHNAVCTLMITCEFFINSKNQCEECPLHKHGTCMLTMIPINWRE